MAGAARTGRSTAWCPTTRPRPPTSSASTPATSARPGAASPRCSSGCRWCGPRRATRGLRLADVVRLDVAGARPSWSASAGKGGDRGRARRRPGRVRARGDASRSTRRGCTTATRSRRTPGGSCAAWSARRGCAVDAVASGVDADDGRRPDGSCGRADMRTCPRRRVLHRRHSRRCPTSPRAASAAAWSPPTTSCSPQRENLIKPEPSASRRAHVRPQGQGVRRLGDPAAPRARATTGRSSGSACPASCTASSSTPRGSPATTRRTSRSRAPRVDGYPSPDELPRRDWTTSGRRSPRPSATPRTPYAVDDRAGLDPRPADASTRTAGWPGSACTASRARPALPDRHDRPGRAGERRPLVACSDVFYGSPANLILPGRAQHDGRGLGERPAPRRRQRLGGVRARGRRA